DLYNDPFKDPIVGQIIAKERELTRRIDAAADGESEEVLNKLYKRYNIFSVAEKMPIVLLSHIQQYGQRC
ncbi:MAG TPA: hypothetical protein VI278_09865, partial [Nitrososphaeraceae archaeon]